MARALLLVNPGARNASDQGLQLAPALEKEGITVVETLRCSPSQFEAAIRRLRPSINVVITAGGDGTCLCAAQTLWKLKIPLGVIPLGTANNLARSLNIPLSPEDAIRVIAQGNTRWIDLATVNGRPFLNVSGIGLSTLVNRGVPATTKKRWGKLAYALYLTKLIRRTSPFVAEINLQGKATRVRSLQLTICNGRHYGSGLTIAEDAAIDDSRLDLVSLNPKSFWHGLKLTPGLLSGRHKGKPGAFVLKERAFEIVTRPPLPIDTDGEITTRTPARYEVIPNALRVYAPMGEDPKVSAPRSS